MLETPDLRFFIALANAPSLAAAARTLNVSAPAVSQRLTQMEQRLGMRLIERGRGRIHLTAEGETLARRALAILDDLSDLNEDLAVQRQEVSGPLRIIAPFGFGRLHVAPVIADLSRQHPKVVPDLVLSDDPYGAANSDNWDLIIQVGPLADSTLVQRKLAGNKRVLCAAPSYLQERGRPKGPEDLKNHSCGVIREDQADVAMWHFSDVKGNKAAVRIRPASTSNNGEVIKSWAIAGLGIVSRSEWDVAKELADGSLEKVLPDFQMPDADIVALMSGRTLRTARVQAALEMLSAAFARPPWR